MEPRLSANWAVLKEPWLLRGGRALGTTRRSRKTSANLSAVGNPPATAPAPGETWAPCCPGVHTPRCSSPAVPVLTVPSPLRRAKHSTGTPSTVHHSLRGQRHHRSRALLYQNPGGQRHVINASRGTSIQEAMGHAKPHVPRTHGARLELTKHLRAEAPAGSSPNADCQHPFSVAPHLLFHILRTGVGWRLPPGLLSQTQHTDSPVDTGLKTHGH